jgi:hypothetical protein
MTLRIKPDEFGALERQYPGILGSIFAFESNSLPDCPHCSSDNTALVQAGVIGRTIHIAAATTKMHLTPNGAPSGERHYCKSCCCYFT